MKAAVLCGCLLYALSYMVEVRGEGEDCDNEHGTCKPIDKCDAIFPIFHLVYNTVKFCDEFNDIVCCPKPIVPAPALPSRPTYRHEKECQSFSEIGTCASTAFIVNGVKAEPREFPFMALVGLQNINTNETNWNCGGTLISAKYVLTAAHCLITNYEKPIFRVRLGDLDYANDTDDAQPQEFVVKNYILHPGYYDDDDEHNDIGLLELDHYASLNEYVKPACLPSTDGREYDQLTATGWGRTKDAGTSSTHLLKVTLDRFDEKRCQEALADHEINTRTQLCAGSFNSNSDTCQGDSGGPVFVPHPRFACLKIVVGITSYGDICGTKNRPSIYTRVHLYTDWIERIVWSL